MAKPKKDAALAARVLVACTIRGERYLPNDVVEGAADLIDEAKADGSVDDHPDAVAYARALKAAADGAPA